MDIITFSEALQTKLKDIDRQAIGQEDLVKTGRALSHIRQLLGELKQFTVGYSFRDSQEEIRFFKEIKPVFLSQYFYYKKMFEALLFDSFRDTKSRIEHYQVVLAKLQRFLRKNKAFYEYCMSGDTSLDGSYFTRNDLHPIPINQHEKFSTGFDIKLSRILAAELVKQYVVDAIRRLQLDHQDSQVLPWTDSKASLIELAYALQAAGVFNHGKSDIKQIIRCFEEMFSIDLGNYARIFMEIRIRKSGPVTFIGHLKDRLSLFVNDLL